MSSRKNDRRSPRFFVLLDLEDIHTYDFSLGEGFSGNLLLLLEAYDVLAYFEDCVAVYGVYSRNGCGYKLVLLVFVLLDDKSLLGFSYALDYHLLCSYCRHSAEVVLGLYFYLDAVAELVSLVLSVSFLESDVECRIELGSRELLCLNFGNIVGVVKNTHGVGVVDFYYGLLLLLGLFCGCFIGFFGVRSFLTLTCLGLLGLCLLGFGVFLHVLCVGVNNREYSEHLYLVLVGVENDSHVVAIVMLLDSCLESRFDSLEHIVSRYAFFFFESSYGSEKLCVLHFIISSVKLLLNQKSATVEILAMSFLSSVYSFSPSFNTMPFPSSEIPQSVAVNCFLPSSGA